MSKIVFLSNIERRSAKIQAVITKLQDAKLLSTKTTYIKINPEGDFSNSFSESLINADLVLMKMMGGSVEAPFFRHLLQFLKERRIKYYINTSGAQEDNLYEGITEQAMLELRKYDFYNGMSNFENMFLFAQFLCDGKTAYRKPEVIPWCGIYHPGTAQIFTN